MSPPVPTFAEDRLNAPQAAAFVGVAVQTLAIDRCTGRLGNIPYYKVGRKVFYTRADLANWLASRRENRARIDEEQMASIPAQGSNRVETQPRREAGRSASY